MKSHPILAALLTGIAAFSGTIALAQNSRDPLLVRIDAGPVLGAEEGEIRSWKGIPFAAPPIGPLRWQPPRKPAAWKVPLKATSFGNECPQNADLGVFARAGGAEDCLTLNVFANSSALASGAKLPVLVWIYGGSLLVGSAADYDASRLAREGKAIVVTFNYRLGVLGFLAHPAIDKEGHAFANYGVMDQTFALDWVQRNIAAFGGDPKNVTIAGESSGGTSVFAQMISPAAAGKFTTAIAMSGSAVIYRAPRFGSATPLDQAEKTGTDFAQAVGCGHETARCLRALPLETILAKQHPYTIVQTIIDGNVLPRPYAEAFQSGKFNHVTLIQGNNRDEARFFQGLGETAGAAVMTPKDYPGAIAGYYGAALADAVLKEYPQQQFDSPAVAWSAAVGDAFFSCPALQIDRWVAGQTPTFAYEFADRTAPPYLGETSFYQGAAHTYELPYLFPGFHGGAGKPGSLNRLQNKLASTMIGYWAQAGDPQSREGIWPRFDPASENVLSLTLPEPRMTSGSYRAVHHCDFWDKTGIY